MRKLSVWTFILCLAFPALLAGAGAPITVVHHGDGLISLYLEQVRVVDAARLLAGTLDADFVLLDDSDEIITLSIERMTPREALDSLIANSQLNWGLQGHRETLAKLVVSTPGGARASASRPAPRTAAVVEDSYDDFVEEEENPDPAAQSFRDALEASRAGNGGDMGQGAPAAAGGASLIPGAPPPMNPFAAALQQARSQTGQTGSSTTATSPAGATFGGSATGTTANPFGAMNQAQSGTGVGSSGSFGAGNSFTNRATGTSSSTPNNPFTQSGNRGAQNNPLAQPTNPTNPFGNPAGNVNPFNPFGGQGTNPAGNQPATNPFLVNPQNPNQNQGQNNQQQQQQNN